MLKRFSWIAPVIALVMLLTMLGGCGNAQQAKTQETGMQKTGTQETASAPAEATVQEQASSTSSTEPEYIKAAATPVTLTMFINKPEANIDLWGKDEVSQYFIEKTGVNLKLEKNTGSDDQKLMLLIASQNLPDIVIAGKDSTPMNKMIESNMIYTYDELMDQYAPNFKTMPIMEANRKYLVKNDKLYYLTSWMVDRSKIDKNIMILGRSGYYVRKDQYESLGSPALKTPDDLENYLKSVKSNYKDVTHPLMLWTPTLAASESQTGINVLYQTFGGKGKYYMDGDKVKLMVRDPRYKETLLYVNKLYREGLVNASDFTDKLEQQQQNNRTGKLGVAVGGLYYRNESDQLTKVIPNASYSAIDPILADGVSEFAQVASAFDGQDAMVVTRKCTAPDRAIKFIEFLATDEAQSVAVCGPKEKYWDYGGTDNNWILPKKELSDAFADWNKFQSTIGGYLYAWIGGTYPDSQFAWGLAANDNEKKKVYELEGKVSDYSEFDGIEPGAGSPESVIATKVEGNWGNFLAKICLAKSEEAAASAYDDMITKIDALEFNKVEDLWTRNHADRKAAFAD
jgi:putative aldouronate transport system substrate-binding protein